MGGGYRTATSRLVLISPNQQEKTWANLAFVAEIVVVAVVVVVVVAAVVVVVVVVAID